jgi:hypothetical protein
MLGWNLAALRSTGSWLIGMRFVTLTRYTFSTVMLCLATRTSVFSTSSASRSTAVTWRLWQKCTYTLGWNMAASRSTRIWLTGTRIIRLTRYIFFTCLMKNNSRSLDLELFWSWFALSLCWLSLKWFKWLDRPFALLLCWSDDCRLQSFDGLSSPILTDQLQTLVERLWTSVVTSCMDSARLLEQLSELPVE